MVDLSHYSARKTRARLPDLVPGRSGKAYVVWLADRGDNFRKNVKVASLDPFADYKTAIGDKPEDATVVVDAFHVVKLGTAAEASKTPSVIAAGGAIRFTESRPSLRADAENLTDKQRARFTAAIKADPVHDEAFVA